MLAINPKIKQKAEDIRKKIFGSEVRESLASGIEAISEDVEATIGRQDYVEEQFQDVLDETTGKDVISAPELIAARNGKSNLKTRLDDEHAQVTAQLQQTANKDEVRFKNVLIGLNDASGDLLSAIQGGEGTSFTLLSEPREESVTPTKNFGAVLGKNLFDNRRVLRGKVFSHSGTDDRLGDYANGFVSDYISVLPQTDYKISGARPSTNTHYAFYDVDKNLLNSSLGDINPTFTTPENAVFMRFDGNLDYINTIQLEKGTIATHYEEFNYSIDRLKVSDPNVLRQLNSPTKPEKIRGYRPGKNRFDKNAVLKNHYFLNPTTSGTPTAVSTFSVTDFIPAKPSQDYTVSGGNIAGSRVAWVLFDEQYSFISGGSFLGDGTFTTTEDTAFYRVDFRNTHIDTLQIEEGSEVTPHEPYSFTLDGLKGSEAEAYNQSLNTYDSVQFDAVTAHAFVADGMIPLGTLANPPEGLQAGDTWADTTDSTAHPVLRVKL